MIYYFDNIYRFLSNFYEVPVTYNGITYQNNEAAFQAQKGDKKFQLELSNLPPNVAKKKGRNVKIVGGIQNWDKNKDRIMYEICKAKFSNPEMRKKLLATHPHILEEGNTWHDNYWGICHCEKCEKNDEGLNHLGQILQRIREEFVAEEIMAANGLKPRE